MVLDIVCICIAVVARIISNKKFSEKLQEIVLGRYLELQSKKEAYGNEPCELFSDDTAISSILNSCK